MTTELQRKIDGSIRLLKSIQKAHPDETIEVAYSGGKDSDVILQLAKEAGINYRAIYKNTTIDPPGTIAHVRAMGVEVRQPTKSFFQLVKEKGLPNRYTRFCCQLLKEYKILDVCIVGVRRAESTKRAKRYTEPTECRFYGSKKDHVEQVFPILEWSDDDVRDFILDRGVTLAPLYYTDGELHIERRLGCIGCPLASKGIRLAGLRQYPNIIKAYARALQIYLDNHPNCKAVEKWGYRNAYEQLVRDLFYDSQEEYSVAVSGGMFGADQALDCKAYLEDYFNIKF